MNYEKKLQLFYSKILSSGMKAVDVGAHLGRHTFEMVRLVGSEGKIFAFEPLPDFFKKLKNASYRADLSKILEVYPYALNNTNGIIDFCNVVNDPGYSGILERHYRKSVKIEHINVESRKLDDIIDSNVGIDYIKIDTEGSEWNVIQGASSTIKKYRPYISFEFGEKSYTNYKVDPNEVFNFFEKIHFRLFDINGAKLNKKEFVISSIEQNVWDYIATPQENIELTNSILCNK